MNYSSLQQPEFNGVVGDFVGVCTFHEYYAIDMRLQAFVKLLFYFRYENYYNCIVKIRWMFYELIDIYSYGIK